MHHSISLWSSRSGFAKTCDIVVIFVVKGYKRLTAKSFYQSIFFHLPNSLFCSLAGSDHWLCLSLTNSLTDSLTHSCLVNLSLIIHCLPLSLTHCLNDWIAHFTNLVDLLAVNDANCLVMS